MHSLFMIQLIMFIEKTFHLELEEEDLDMDNIKTVRDLVVLIERHQPTGAEI
ncbi:acyl carrier protein [compost metagenome]